MHLCQLSWIIQECQVYRLNLPHSCIIEFTNLPDKTPGGGVLPYKGLMGTCGQPGYVFRDFVLNRVSNLSFSVLIRVSIYQFLS